MKSRSSTDKPIKSTTDGTPVIESGNTVEGIQGGAKYVCRFEDALAAPNRIVLDINPGPAFAAGNR
jgi:hypothetical protein